MDHTDIITLVKDPGSAARHVLRTAGPDAGWRRRPALCGAEPPASAWWLSHHSSPLAALCPLCAVALAGVVARRHPEEARP